MRERSGRLGCRVIALLFDGLLLTNASGADFGACSNEIREIFGVSPTIKEVCARSPMSCPSRREPCVPPKNSPDFWAKLLEQGEITDDILITIRGGYKTCLPEAVLNLAPAPMATNLSNIATVGPFTFRQIESFCGGEIFFEPADTDTPLPAGRYVLFALNHAVGVEIQHCGRAKIMDATRRASVVLAGSSLQMFLAESIVQIFVFRVRFGRISSCVATPVRGAELLDLTLCRLQKKWARSPPVQREKRP